MSNHDTHTDEHAHAHGHPVVSWQIQLGVLAALLFFTFSTVLFYNLEAWAEHAFEITLPGWVNVVGAMSIATVKALLVCMFFMGLKYDKALNTFALLFCLFCVGLFLAFSMIDLDSRDRVYTWKRGEITQGGTGKGLDAPARDPRFSAYLGNTINTGGKSIVEYSRDEAIAAAGSPEAFWAELYHHHPHERYPDDTNDYFSKLGYGHLDELPTANKSMPRRGLTPGLFSAVDPAELHDEHGGGHGSDHDGAADGSHATEAVEHTDDGH